MTIKKKEEEWRKLCQLVAGEVDPRRLSKLVDRLIEKLNGRREGLRRSKRQGMYLGRKE